MRRQRPKQRLVPFLLGLMASGAIGVAIAVAIGAAGDVSAVRVGLGFDSASSGPSLSALVQPELVLMSCADDAGAAYSMLAAGDGTQSPEPLWCENPDSPQCLPGDSAPLRHQPWIGPLGAGWLALTAAPSHRLWRVRSSWPRAQLTVLVSKAIAQRLERPPRIG